MLLSSSFFVFIWCCFSGKEGNDVGNDLLRPSAFLALIKFPGAIIEMIKLHGTKWT